MSTHPDNLVTLTRFGDLTTAQLLCGRLEAEGIASLIPDEVMAAQNWHLNRAIGGIRVQVRQEDLERAQEILAQPGLEPDTAAANAETQVNDGQVNDGDDGSISQGDRAAYRALRVALVSLWLMGLIHPYSLWLAVRSLGGADLTPWGRRRGWMALFISLAGCLWMGFLIYRALKLAG